MPIDRSGCIAKLLNMVRETGQGGQGIYMVDDHAESEVVEHPKFVFTQMSPIVVAAIEIFAKKVFSLEATSVF